MHNFFTAQTKANGALFNVVAEDRKENGPIMTGNLEVDGKRIHVSGFLRTSSTNGTEYLSLAFSAPLPEGYTDQDKENQLRYYGKLFRQTEKRTEKSPDYNGFISVLPCTSQQQYTDEEWDQAPTLQINAWRKRSADGGSRISFNVAPREVSPDEVNF